MLEAKFYIGQIIHHKRFGYRGVVYGVDPYFSGSEDWYETMATSRPPKDKPWYYVLVDGAKHTTYVAEQNLKAGDDLSQIEHPLTKEFFKGHDGERYLPTQRTN